MDVPALRASTTAPHGVKRRAEDDPRDEQRLSKRFDLLNLGIQKPSKTFNCSCEIYLLRDS